MNKQKKCTIVVNGYASYPSQLYQLNRIIEELNAVEISSHIAKGNELLSYIDMGEIKTCFQDSDFVLFLDKDIHLSHMIENAGYLLINNASSIELCDDKMKTYVYLANKSIKIPKTVSSPLMYVESDDLSFLEKVEDRIDYPIVVKENYGSLGKEVYLAKDKQELIALYSKIKHVPHLYQEFVGNGGEDIRVLVIGGKVVAAMKRTNKNDFRSNIELGGKGESIDLSDEIVKLCESIAKYLDIDYVGIDVLIGKDGYYFCEANSNAFFSGLEKTTGKNIAKLYAEYINKKVYGD